MITRQDEEALADAFELRWNRLRSYNPFEDQEALTQELESEGQRIREALARGQADAAELRRFLKRVGHWKMPHTRGNHDQNVDRNDDAKIIKVLLGVLEEPDAMRISTCTRLIGFGAQTGSTPMASALLRFLWPENYAVVDWRNWAVLSNFRHRFLSSALLEPLADTFGAFKEARIDPGAYRKYLAVIRNLADRVGFASRAADVDLAIYSYSVGVWPFYYDPGVTEQAEKILREPLTVARGRKKPSLNIFESLWDVWQSFGDIEALNGQLDAKLRFLRDCGDLIPEGIQHFDDRTMRHLDYRVVYQRDLADLERRLDGIPFARAQLREVDNFVWHKRLKGEGLGVARPARRP